MANGPTTAPIALTDSLPTGVTLAGAVTATGGILSGCPGVGANNLNGCTTDAGTSGPIAITVPVNVASNYTTLTNTASIAGGGDPNCTVTTPCSGSVTETNRPKLTVSRRVSAAPLSISSTTQTYSIIITVANATTTAPILISDLLPAGITTRAAITTNSGVLSGCPGAGATSLAGCSLSVGRPVGTVIVTVPISVSASATSGDNTASVTGGGDPLCNSSTPCRGSVVVPVQPQLRVTKTVSQTPLVVGKSGQFYTITVNVNNGPTSAPITFADTLPTGITANGPGITATGGTLSGCPTSTTAANLSGCSIAAGTNGPVVLTIPINVTSAASHGNNTVTVSGADDSGCPADTARCTSTVTVPVAPTLLPRKTRSGATSPANANYDFVFSANNGFGSQTITTAGAVTNLAGTVTGLSEVGTVTTLSEAAVEGFQVTAISCTGATASNYTVDLANRSVTLNAAATASGVDSICTFTNTARPVLNLSKTASKGHLAVNDSFSYTLSVRNSGAAVATVATSIRDIIPVGITITAVAPASGWSCTRTPTGTAPIVGAGNTTTMVNCSPSAALAPSASAANIVTLTATKTAGGSIANTALVQNGGGDVACAGTTPTAGAPARCSSTVTVDSQTGSSVTLSKTSINGTGSFDFTGNNGIGSQTLATSTAGTPVAGVQQLLTTPGTVTTVTEAANTNFQLTDITCSGLGASGTASVDLPNRRVTLDEAATAAGSGISCVFTNNNIQSDVRVIKSASQTSVVAGAELAYTLTVDNVGNGPAANVVLTDILGQGLDCTRPNTTASCTATGGASCPAATVPVADLVGSGITLPNVPVGGTVVVELLCTVTATGQP